MPGNSRQADTGDGSAEEEIDGGQGGAGCKMLKFACQQAASEPNVEMRATQQFAQQALVHALRHECWWRVLCFVPTVELLAAVKVHGLQSFAA